MRQVSFSKCMSTRSAPRRWLSSASNAMPTVRPAAASHPRTNAPPSLLAHRSHHASTVAARLRNGRLGVPTTARSNATKVAGVVASVAASRACVCGVVPACSASTPHSHTATSGAGPLSAASTSQ